MVDFYRVEARYFKDGDFRKSEVYYFKTGKHANEFFSNLYTNYIIIDEQENGLNKRIELNCHTFISYYHSMIITLTAENFQKDENI